MARFPLKSSLSGLGSSEGVTLIRQPIRNLSSSKPVPPRFCDVIVEGDEVTLEVKTDKNKYETISWNDMKYQVEAAKKKAANMK